MRSRTCWTVVCAAVVLGIGMSSAWADAIPAGARSASSAILGAEGFFAGALPPPGFHALSYTLLYTADELKGKNGGEVDAPPFSDFQAWAYAEVLRGIYVSKMEIFGANPAWHVVVPVVHKHQGSDFFEDSMDGVGDIYVSPLILGWHKPPFHWVAGLDVIVPTGHYSSTDITTIGNNHWTFEPAFAVSYIDDNGITASTKLMFDFHSTDPALDYREGDQFHLDYHAGYRFGKDREWQAGVSGYYLVNVQDDKQAGHRIDDSKEQVFAIGPSVAYMKGPLSIEAKCLIETDAQNRPEGTATWLKVIFSF